MELGKTYPQPIVDHKVGRERALAAYAKVRNSVNRDASRLTRRKNPAIVIASTKPLGDDDMDDEKPVLEHVTDAMSTAADRDRWKPPSRRSRRSEGRQESRKEGEPKKSQKGAEEGGEESQEGCQEIPAKKSAKKTAKKAAKKTSKKTAKKKKKAKKSKR